MRWNPRSQQHAALTDWLHRADPKDRLITEILVTQAADVKCIKSHWAAGTQSPADSFEFFEDGSAKLKPTSTSMASQTGDDDDHTDLNDASPLYGVRIQLGVNRTEVGEQVRLREFKAKLDKRRTGDPAFTGTFALQIYALTSWETRRLAPLLSPVAVVYAEDMTEDPEIVTFDLRSYALENSTIPAFHYDLDGMQGTYRVLYFVIFARPTTKNGEEAVGADNVSWRKDTTSPVLNHITGVSNYTVSLAVTPDLEITTESRAVSWEFYHDLYYDKYPDPSSYCDLTMAVDLGAAPQSDTALEIEFSHAEPPDTDSVAEIKDDGTWYECVDGDVIGENNTARGGKDLSALTRQQTYDIRWRAKANTPRDTSPTLYRFGVRERKSFDITPLVEPNEVLTWQADPVTLEGAVGEARIQIVRDGLRDFRDLATRLVTDYNFRDIEVRIFAGHPELSRSSWGLIEVLRVDDRKPLWTSEEFVGVSVLEQLKGLIPPYDPLSSPPKRIPKVYENVTVKAVIEDVVDTQAALPGRYRGQLLENTTDTVTKVVDECDALEEASALAYIDGKALIASQGRVKAVNMFGDISPVEIVAREECEIREFDLGLRRRQPALFVRYGYNWREDREFAGEVRSFNDQAIAAIGYAKIEQEPLRPPEAVEKWLRVSSTGGNGEPLSSVADKIAPRIPRFIGTGLILAQVRFSYARPWLEIGDAVAINQDFLTGRDPVTGREIYGPAWVIGVIAEQYDFWGRNFLLWVRGYFDIIPGTVAVDRLGYGEPTAWPEEDPIPGQPENARYRFHVWPEASSSIYYIYQAMTATVPERSPSGSGWTSISAGDSKTFLRDESVAKKLSVYAVHQGHVGPIYTLVVGPDRRAQIVTLTLTQQGTGAGAIDVKVGISPDADLRRWRIYRRTHATDWPTTDGTQTGPIDEQYFRAELDVDSDGGGILASGAPTAGGLEFVDDVNGTSGDVVRYIIIPKDVNGTVGPRKSDYITLAGSASPEILTFTATPSGTTCATAQVTVNWTTQNASDPNQDLKIYRRVNGSAWDLRKTEYNPVGTTQWIDTVNVPINFSGSGEQHKLEYKGELVTGTEIEDQATDTAYDGLAGECPA